MQPPTDHVKSIWTTALERIERVIETHMTAVAREWQTNFPKRQIRFMDAMGMAGFLLDGEWVEIPQKYAHRINQQATVWSYTSGEQHKHMLLMPLFDAMEWYATMMDECDDMISVEFTLEPLK